MNRRIRTNTIKMDRIGSGYGGGIAAIYIDGKLQGYASIDVMPGRVEVYK